jgi:hypothetical protein
VTTATTVGLPIAAAAATTAASAATSSNGLDSDAYPFAPTIAAAAATVDTPSPGQKRKYVLKGMTNSIVVQEGAQAADKDTLGYAESELDDAHRTCESALYPRRDFPKGSRHSSRDKSASAECACCLKSPPACALCQGAKVLGRALVSAHTDAKYAEVAFPSTTMS